MSERNLRTLYEDLFLPQYYVSTYYFNIDAGNEFILRNLHTFFKDEWSSKNKTISKRILEIGSGPVPIHIISASRWSNEIIMSDFLEQNREKLQEWLSGGDEADKVWLPYAQYIAELEAEAESEGKISSKATSIDLLKRARRSVCAIIPCDVSKSDVLQGNTESLFDVVISVFCLECAVASQEDFAIAIKNVVKFLRPSGHLIMVGAIEGEKYYIRDKAVPRIKLTREIIESALEKAGCQIVSWQELARSLRPRELPIDYKAMYFCAAKKI